MNTNKENMLIDTERRAIESSHDIQLAEKRLFPKRVVVVAFMLSFLLTYLFMNWVLDQPYLNFSCLYNDAVIEHCTVSEFSEGFFLGLIINIILAAIIPFWILTMFAEWAYKLGKEAESELVRLTVDSLKHDGSIDEKCAEVVLDGVVSLHWSPSEKMSAATSSVLKNSKDE